MSEGEPEDLQNIARHQQVNQEDDRVFHDIDPSPALAVSKILTHQHDDFNQ